MKLADLSRFGRNREQAVAVTSLPEPPEQERKRRMLKYVLAMSLRTVCVPIAVFTDGPIRWAAMAGAVLLPYFAVVIANAVSGGQPTSFQSVEPYTLPSQSTTDTD
jgi:Protein of unknown function (DUF3099)